MKPKYHAGQLISYINRNRCVCEGRVILGKWQHYVGYVKQVRRSLLGVGYVVMVSTSSEIHIIPERDVMNIVEYREDSNKPNK